MPTTHLASRGVKRLKDVIWFLAICFGFTYALHAILYLIGGLASWAALPILLMTMFIPLISAAVVIKLRLHLRFKDFGLEAGKSRYYLYAYLYPFLVLGLGILFVALLRTTDIVLNLEEFKRNLLLVPLGRLQPILPIDIGELPGEVIDLTFYITLFLLPIAPFINAVPAFGEEYGWRGFLLQRLSSRYGLTFSLVAVGIIWGLWHAPLILMGYNYPSYPNAVGISAFTVWTVMTGYFLGWLRVKSGSVYSCALAHGAINAYMGLGLIIAPNSNELVTLPLGIPALLALTLIAVLAYMDLKRSSLLKQRLK